MIKLIEAEIGFQMTKILLCEVIAIRNFSLAAAVLIH